MESIGNIKPVPHSLADRLHVPEHSASRMVVNSPLLPQEQDAHDFRETELGALVAVALVGTVSQ